MITEAVIVREFGGPEVLKLEKIVLPDLAAKEVLIKQTAIGVNFIDTYFRTGLYPIELPFTPGEEGIGFIEEVGSDVTEFKIGDRVAYSTNYHNSYMSYKILGQEELISVPNDLTDAQVASSLLRGLTAEYLLFRCYQLQAEQTVLIHAVTGGIGAILCQWAKQLGARVFGTVGSKDKIELAKYYGCDEVIDYEKDSFLKVIREKTNGALVDVVYDSVGKVTLEESLRCVKQRGLLVSFGNASGAPNPINVMDILSQGSIFFTRPKLADYINNHQDYTSAASNYLSMLSTGKISVPKTIELPLKDAEQAHRLLADRSVIEIPLLIPA